MEWTRGHVLGRGSSATVSAATSTSGDVFAVKSVEFSQSESLRNEQHFLSMLKSPYVVDYKGCDITTQQNTTLYNIFIDYMSGGSITDLINQRNGEGFNDYEIRSYTRQIVKGLDYIHSNGIVHCDIKGANILLHEGSAKISDFGCAKQGDQVAPFRGTPMYMAPEVARGEEQGSPADIWALGCTVIEMATGGSPWPNVTNPVSVLYKIAYSGEIPMIPWQLSEVAKDFVSKCLVVDPKQRWTAKELMEHAYIRQQFDENSKQNVCDKVRTDSPTSILDQDVWNMMEEATPFSSLNYLLSNTNTYTNTKTNIKSLGQRIKKLSDKSDDMPDWRSEKWETSEWMTIRS